jgi:hypothetical protein
MIDGVLHLVPTNKTDIALLYLTGGGAEAEEQVQNLLVDQVSRCAHRSWEWVSKMCGPINK